MYSIPIKYNIRNLIVRWKSTFMTALSIGFVVSVFIIIMSMAEGLKDVMIQTSDPLNIMVLRQGSTAETTSFISRESYRIVKHLPGIAKGPNNEILAAGEVTVLMNLLKKSDNIRSNVLIRGVSPESFILHPQVKIVSGRLFQPGLREIIVSQTIANRYYNMGLGDKIFIGKGYWTVVGHFDASRTAFDSEIWGDAMEIAADFNRESYSIVVLRVTDKNSVDNIIRLISDDPQLNLKAYREEEYYLLQTAAVVPLQLIGSFLAVIMSIGAIFAAINTMYESVANRTREIGTLRVVGYSRNKILISFMLESVLLSLLGGILGCLLSLPMDGLTTATANFRTFSEITFHFQITIQILLLGIIFSILMGLIGGILPAISAARKPIIGALREIG